MNSILQIVPRVPGGRDGVGDYAQTLAQRLEKSHGLATKFISGAELQELPQPPAAGAIILHYVNYGYDPRGVPLWLPTVLRRLRGSAKLLTVFHELYASGSWRQSAFWLQPLQKRIARSIAGLSEAAIVSSEVLREQLTSLTAKSRIIVHPVFSNFGEPDLTGVMMAERDPHRWVICGGTKLIERSVRSFLQAARGIAAPFAPRELFVVGGTDTASIRQQLKAHPGIEARYHPEIDAAEASRILSACAFGWVDYFVRPGVPTSAVLKSTAFAACCAHGVIPVFPHRGSVIARSGDALPGPFFVAPAGQSFPGESERPAVAQSIQAWYQRHASSAHLAETVASALAL
ncbi:MAG: hypothetical protein H0T83_07790 [Chthoniobacterales bacterium]|nr:hypothetical protein [Chthoniobacterales bacterium]